MRSVMAAAIAGSPPATPFSLPLDIPGAAAAITVANDRYLLNPRHPGENSQHNNVQAMCADNANQLLYTMQRNAANTGSIISQYPLGGFRPNASTKRCAVNTALGHTSLTIDPVTGEMFAGKQGSSTQLTGFFFPAADAGATTGDRVVGIHTDLTGTSSFNYSHFTISADGVYYVSALVTGTNVLTVRVGLMSAFRALGAGAIDASAIYTNQFTLTGFVNDSAYALQGICSDGQRIVIIAGFGDTASSGLIKIREYAMDASGANPTPLNANNAIDVSTYPWQVQDSVTSTGWEPQAGAFIQEAGSSTYHFHLLTATGNSSNGRFCRVWRLSGDYVPTAAQYRAAYAAVATGESTGFLDAYEAFIAGLIADGDLRHITCGWGLCSESKANGYINLFDPGKFSLTDAGTGLVFNLKTGMTGSGNIANYAIGPRYCDVPGFTYLVGGVYQYTDQPGTDTGAFVACPTTPLLLYARDASNLGTYRFNAPSQTPTAASTDGSGLFGSKWSETVALAYELVRSGVQLGTTTGASKTTPGTDNIRIGASASLASTKRHQMVLLGAIPKARMASVEARCAAFVSAVGAL